MFWWLVVACTMLVLTVIYTCQFQHFSMYWHNLTRFSDEPLGYLGLGQFSVFKLFSSILMLASSCSPASYDYTISTNPSCSSPTWGMCLTLHPHPVPPPKLG